MYKSKLPFIIAFNKTDVASHEVAVSWMRDFESFSVCYVLYRVPFVAIVCLLVPAFTLFR